MSEVSTSQSAPEECVQQFMAEYDKQWRIAAPVFEADRSGGSRDPFQLWRDLMAHTQRHHFTESTAVNLAQSFGSPAAYGSEAEVLVQSEIHDDRAYVLTQVRSPLDMYHEYTLGLQGSEWKISAITQHFGDPAEPFVDRTTVEENVLSSTADAPLVDLPEEQAQLDETRNFTDRQVLRGEDGETTQVQVSQIGTLVTSTGVLSVLDFGYDNDDARPLARTVAPGAYPVDRVTGFDRNAAVRVRFSTEVPVSWHAATRSGSGHVIGVDAGCICIVDYVGYSTMTRRAKAASYDGFTATVRPAALEVPLGGADVGIALDSGYGDGSYPAYWGVDSHGYIAQLVIDFMVLVTEDDDGVLTHL